MFLKNANELMRNLILDTYSLTDNWYVATDGNPIAGRCYSTADWSNAGTSRYESSPFILMQNIAKGDCIDTVTSTYGQLDGKQSYGVVFGDGTVAPSVEDYSLSGNAIEGLVKGTNITVKITDSKDKYYDEQTCVYTITNTGTEAITIGEVALVCTYFSYTRTSSNYEARRMPFIIERTLLEAPITIEAGGVGQVTYTIRMNYPIS